MPRATKAPFPEDALAALRKRVLDAIGRESRKSFASRAGLSEGAISNALNHGIPTIELLHAISKATSLSLAYLVSGDDSAPSAGSEYKPIPRFDVQASAGRGRIVGRDQVEEIGPIMALREDYLRKIGLSPAQAHIVTASGASMEPTIRDGDLLVIDRRRQRVADRPASTAPPIFVVTWNDAVLVKRVARVKGGGVLLQSDNPAYPSELVQPDELGALSIEGQVRWITRMT